MGRGAATESGAFNWTMASPAPLVRLNPLPARLRAPTQATAPRAASLASSAPPFSFPLPSCPQVSFELPKRKKAGKKVEKEGEAEDAEKHEEL